MLTYKTHDELFAEAHYRANNKGFLVKAWNSRSGAFMRSLRGEGTKSKMAKIVAMSLAKGATAIPIPGASMAVSLCITKVEAWIRSNSHEKKKKAVTNNMAARPVGASALPPRTARTL